MGASFFRCDDLHSEIKQKIFRKKTTYMLAVWTPDHARQFTAYPLPSVARRKQWRVWFPGPYFRPIVTIILFSRIQFFSSDWPTQRQSWCIWLLQRSSKNNLLFLCCSDQPMSQESWFEKPVVLPLHSVPAEHELLSFKNRSESFRRGFSSTAQVWVGKRKKRIS